MGTGVWISSGFLVSCLFTTRSLLSVVACSSPSPFLCLLPSVSTLEWLVLGWLLPCGATGAVIVAVGLVEAQEGASANMAPVLTCLFTPLFAVVLLVFLATMMWTSSSIDVEREVLIGFDLLLVLVLGLLLYAVSARDQKAPPNAFDVLQLSLIIAALVVDLVALAAITARISEFGFSPNKLAALGGKFRPTRQPRVVSLDLYAFPPEACLLRRPRVVADPLPTRVFSVGCVGSRHLPAAVRLHLKVEKGKWASLRVPSWNHLCSACGYCAHVGTQLDRTHALALFRQAGCMPPVS